MPPTLLVHGQTTTSASNEEFKVRKVVFCVNVLERFGCFLAVQWLLLVHLLLITVYALSDILKLLFI